MEAISHKDAPLPYERLQMTASHFIRIPEGGLIDVKLQYPLLKMENAVNTCYLRQEVFQKLLVAQSLELPGGGCPCGSGSCAQDLHELPGGYFSFLSKSEA